MEEMTGHRFETKYLSISNVAFPRKWILENNESCNCLTAENFQKAVIVLFVQWQ